jgi:phage terminase Nu1 subunit (DNA packaging protein)
MKKSPSPAPGVIVDVTQLARLIDLTPRRVQQLTNEGVLVRARDAEGNEIRGRYDFRTNNVAYIRYLRTLADRAEVSDKEFAQHKNTKAAAEAEMAVLRLRIFKNQLHRAEDVEFVMTNMHTAFKQRAMAIPSRVTRLILGQTKFQVVYDLIMAEIRHCLQEFSDYDSSRFAAQNEAYLMSQGVDLQKFNGDPVIGGRSG